MRAENDPAQRVVVDSSFVIRVLNRPSASKYGSIWRRWEADDTAVYAPTLLAYEVTNAFWQYENSGQLSPDAVMDSIDRLSALQIEYVSIAAMHKLAIEFVRRYRESKAYDSHFLAVADLLACDLWTSDKKLYNRVGRALSWVRLVDD
jgi:predicted nucleic acid-binding protein